MRGASPSLPLSTVLGACAQPADDSGGDALSRASTDEEIMRLMADPVGWKLGWRRLADPGGPLDPIVGHYLENRRT